MALVFTICINEIIGNKILYMIWSLLILSSSCGMTLLLPTGYAKSFGENNLSLVYGVVQLVSVNRFIYE
jgi:hypothetical protein